MHMYLGHADVWGTAQWDMLLTPQLGFPGGTISENFVDKLQAGMAQHWPW